MVYRSVERHDTRNMEELLTVKQTAHTLRVHETTVRRWIRNGFLEAIQLPGHTNAKRKSLRIKRSTVDKVLTSTLHLAGVKL